MDSKLRFVNTSVFHSYIDTRFVIADARGKSAYDVARSKGHAW